MPRKLIKKYMPDERKLKSNRYLSWLGSYIHDPNLWHLTRKSVSKAFFVGLFCAFIPLLSQMVIAAVVALFIRSNLPISVSLVWITNPITIPPMFYFAYWVGTLMVGADAQQVEFVMSVEWLTTELSHIWLPLLVGSLTCGIVSGTLGYFLMQGFWVWQVNKSWRKRQTRSSAKKCTDEVAYQNSDSDDTDSKKPE